MKVLIITNEQYKNLQDMISYLKESERNHYETSTRAAKKDHIYKKTLYVEFGIETSEKIMNKDQENKINEVS